MGDFTSGCCMANAPIVDEAGIVQLSPTASNPTYAGMSDWCFSIMGRQDGEAPFFARYILKKYMGVKKVGVIYINSDWGMSAFDNFKKEAKLVGLDIVADVSYVQDEKDFSSLITRLRSARPEVVLIMDQGAVPQVINQIRASGWNIPLTTLGPGTSEQLINLTKENSEGLLLSTPFFFDPADPRLRAVVHAARLHRPEERSEHGRGPGLLPARRDPGSGRRGGQPPLEGAVAGQEGLQRRRQQG